MSSFRRQKTVLSESVGSYVDGLWVAGERSSKQILASIQPVIFGQDLQALEQGRRLSDYIKVYTTSNLTVTGDGEGTQPDILVHEGYGYEIVSVFANRSGVIQHYKYIAVKVFKYSSEADWLSGALKRP